MTKLMHFQFLHKFGLKDMDLGTNPECHLVKIPLDILYQTQSLLKSIHPETMPLDTILEKLLPKHNPTRRFVPDKKQLIIIQPDRISTDIIPLKIPPRCLYQIRTKYLSDKMYLDKIPSVKIFWTKSLWSKYHCPFPC